MPEDLLRPSCVAMPPLVVRAFPEMEPKMLDSVVTV